MSSVEQTESAQSASQLENAIRTRILSYMQQTSNDDQASGIVEDFRQTIDMITRVAPRSLSANGTLQRSPNNSGSTRSASNERRRSDTVIVFDSSNVPNGLNGHSRHNEADIAVPSNPDQGQQSTDATSNANNAERSLQREMNHFREFLQNSENWGDVKGFVGLIFFLLMVLLENILENLVSSAVFILSFIFFHSSNATLINSITKKRSIAAVQPIMISLLYFFITNYFSQLDFFLLSLCFIGGLPMGSGFFETLYVVLITDQIAKLITVQIKSLVILVPKSVLNVRRQRRIFQMIEYASQLYRYFLPTPHWCRYFNYWILTIPALSIDNTFAVIYISYKFISSRTHFVSLFNSLLYVLHITSMGQKPSKVEIEETGHCTICFGELKSPVKLSCGHIFCEECIGTWLDKEHSCPICRATVAVEDNSWKSGATTYMIQAY